MFETRVHKIAEFDGLNKRKLWEGWLQWANRLSRIDSDNIKRRQFTRENFRLNSFIEMYSINHPAGGGSILGKGSNLIAGSEEFITLETSGEYWITWSLTLKVKTGGCRTAFAMPFIGDSFIGSAQDCYCEMGWYNNQELAEAVKRSATSVGRFGLLDEDEVEQIRHQTDMPWEDAYGKKGVHIQTRAFTGGTKELIPPQLKTGGFVHLSGSGGAYVSRSTGSIGILVSGFKGSRFDIMSSSISIHKRSR